MPKVVISSSRAGFRINEFAAACGIGRRTIYDLPPELRPKTVKIGRSVIIIELPNEYLRRIAEIEAAKTLPVSNPLPKTQGARSDK